MNEKCIILAEEIQNLKREVLELSDVYFIHCYIFNMKNLINNIIFMIHL